MGRVYLDYWDMLVGYWFRLDCMGGLGWFSKMGTGWEISKGGNSKVHRFSWMIDDDFTAGTYNA